MTICPVCETQNEPQASHCAQCNWSLSPATTSLFLVPNQQVLNQYNERLKSYRQRHEKAQETKQFKENIQALEQTVAQLQQNYQQLEEQVKEQAQEIARLKAQMLSSAQDNLLPSNNVPENQDNVAEEQSTTDSNTPSTTQTPEDNIPEASIEADIWVATDGSGDYTSLQNAIDAAQTGAKIGIKPGDYYSSIPGEPCLVLNKAVFLIGGQTDLHQVRLHGQIQVITNEGGFKNLTISGENGYAVTIEQGNIAFENIQVLMGIHAQGNSSVIISESKVHGSTSHGVRIEAGMLLMENTEICENEFDGIFISPEGRYTIKGAHIHDNKRYGINSRTMQGRGIIEGARFNSNEYGGILVLNGQYVTIKNCAINFNTGPGIYVNESKVTITGCDLASNRRGSIEQHGNSQVNAVNNQE